MNQVCSVAAELEPETCCRAAGSCARILAADAIHHVVAASGLTPGCGAPKVPRLTAILPSATSRTSAPTCLKPSRLGTLQSKCRDELNSKE